MSPAVTCERSQSPNPFTIAADLLVPGQMYHHGRLDGADWAEWLTSVLGSYCTAPFAPHHAQFWAWVWAIEPGIRPDPFVAIWARGAAKSSSAEMAVVVLAARAKRRYALWVCATQEQADDHVSNVATMLESRQIETNYPSLADRMMGKYGNSKGWRRNRLRTAAGFTLDAIGLDTAARGAKLEEYRPDLIIFDDIDSGDDSPEITERKIRTITRALIPAGSPDVAILAIQNLIHPDSIFAQLADGRAKFLRRRRVSGPIPAIEGLVYADRDDRTVITAGEPTWAGQSMAACQAIIDDSGISAFLAECQHDVTAAPGGMYDHLRWNRCTWEQVPWGMLVRTVVWVDPAGTSSSTSDSCGLQADAIAVDGTIYRLHSWEERATPQEAIIRALRVASWLGADKVGIETDYGGDTWLSVFAEARRATGIDVAFDSEKAGAGHGSKTHRSAQMLADYERPRRIIHVEGTHLVLEAALRRFPRTKPFDLADACFWSWRDLRMNSGGFAVPEPDAARAWAITEGLMVREL